ncbi:hypothetical protein MFRU_005g04260 [Monilinia fructicola]|uniref:Uncharacterized protein n=1 Tax=Monilinia fructicola TaxID=38448 RepID=A0A5M9JNY8_MONFR|nr:hypothetical protein EYC84_002656 [Monilinia fructicola]KAG4033419.1 hypothetical protein MFRU_005g04260 [Monilinia fructicola]
MPPTNNPSAPPSYRTAPPTLPPAIQHLNNLMNNNLPSEYFNATSWFLGTQRIMLQSLHFPSLLSFIFRGSDSWWNEFIPLCDLFCQAKYGNQRTSIWQCYTTSQVLSKRAEFLRGGRNFADESRELCDWLAFCIRDFRNSGIEWQNGTEFKWEGDDDVDAFNSTDWLRETENCSSSSQYHELLGKIFASPDQWFADFIGSCAETLGRKFRTLPNSTWDKYNVGKIHFIRNGYLKRHHNYIKFRKGDSKDLVRWLAFCVQELKNEGIEWRMTRSGKVELRTSS